MTRNRFWPSRGAMFAIAAAMPVAARADIAGDARALVERAVAHVRTVGPERGYPDLEKPGAGFIEGELYVFCMTGNGTVLVNAGNPKLKGRVMWDLHDRDGRPVIAEMITTALREGSGWVQYVWPNPATGHLQRKNTFVVKVDDNAMCGSGYYLTEAP